MTSLENRLKQMIAVDMRPLAKIDRFQVGAGQKRTTIRDAHVIPLAGATLPVKQLMLDKLANAGITVRGVLKQGPLLRSAIRQGQLADCYMLSTLLCLCLIAPTWLDDYNILPVNLADGTPGCLLFYYEQKSNSIVQITTSLEVSTSYNNSNDADIRPELQEKGFAFFRSGVQDYYKINFGGTDYAYAIGLRSAAARQQSQLPSAFIDLHRNLNRGILILTATTAKILIGQHAYTALNGTTLINPWNGSVDVPVLESTLQNGAEVAAMYALEPAGILPKLSPQIVPLPNPMPPAVPVSPEKPMEVTLTPVLTINGVFAPGTKYVVRSKDVVSLSWTSSNADEVFYSFGWGERAGGTVNTGVSSTLPTSRKIYLRAISATLPEVRYEVDVTVADAPPVTPDVKPTVPAVTYPQLSITLNSDHTVTGTWK